MRQLQCMRARTVVGCPRAKKRDPPQIRAAEIKTIAPGGAVHWMVTLRLKRRAEAGCGGLSAGARAVLCRIVRTEAGRMEFWGGLARSRWWWRLARGFVASLGPGGGAAGCDARGARRGAAGQTQTDTDRFR